MDEVIEPKEIKKAETPWTSDGKTYTHFASGTTKAQAVADAINRLLQSLSIKCAKSEGIRDYYSVGLLGYGGQDSTSHVGSVLTGTLSGKSLVPISAIAANPTRIETRNKKVSDGAGGLVEQSVRFPIWLNPTASGGTPMRRVLTTATEVIQGWIASHQDSFPPIVINITDGESTDGDPTTAARRLTTLSTRDGNVLFFNAHVSTQAANVIEFPDSEAVLPDKFAKLLFDISSPLPEYMRSIAHQDGFRVSQNTRGFVFNGKMEQLIHFLDIGTKARMK
jgi:hypothetical protein